MRAVSRHLLHTCWAASSAWIHPSLAIVWCLNPLPTPPPPPPGDRAVQRVRGRHAAGVCPQPRRQLEGQGLRRLPGHRADGARQDGGGGRHHHQHPRQPAGGWAVGLGGVHATLQLWHMSDVGVVCSGWLPEGTALACWALTRSRMLARASHHPAPSLPPSWPLSFCRTSSPSRLPPSCSRRR